jgi:Major tropism determinant N-terminal domain
MTTAVQVQYRRGTQSQMAAFTGAAGEMNVDTTNNRVVVQDGATAGGWPAAKLADIGGGDLNKFRNGTMDVWQRGTAPSLTAGASGSQYTADGWIVNWSASASAAPSISQAGGRLLTKNSLQVTGATNITDAQVAQRIESLIAAALCSQTVTVQARVYNNTGGSITPTLTVSHAGSQDNWTSPTTDINAVSLQSCANGAWTLLAYTFQASASSYNGVQVLFDFGNNFGSSGKSIQITECDIRVTNGVPTGLNANPPPPELRPIWTELQICQRYLYVLNQSGGLNIVMFGEAFSTSAAFFSFALPTPQRAAPAITLLPAASDWQIVYGAASSAAVSSLGATKFGANEAVGQININVSGTPLTIGQAVGLETDLSAAQTAVFSSEL